MSGVRAKQLLLNAVAGCALCGAYAPFGWFLVAPPLIAVVSLFWSRAAPRAVLLYGWVFGFAYFSCSCHWVYFSVHDYGRAPVAVAFAITALLAAALALYSMGLAYCVRRTRSAPLLLRAMVWSSLWFAAEWLRGVVVSSFPWNLLGQSLVDSPLLGWLPVLGVYGSGWLLAFVGIVSFECIRRRDWRFFALPALLVVVGVAAASVRWTGEKGEPVHAALIQANVPQAVRFDRENIRLAIREYTKMTRAAPDGALIIWPEAAVPVPYDRLEKGLFRHLANEVEERGSRLLSGVFVRLGDQVYNGAVYLGEDPQFYFKRRLVPFGEYLPGRFLLERLRQWIVMPMSDLSAGDLPPVLDIGEHRAGIAICYEAIFPGLAADALTATDHEANYFIHLSNDAWFGDSIAAWQHLQMARLRAAEFARPVLRATTTGISAIIDHYGQVLQRSGQGGRQTLTASIQPRQGFTPYTIWGDWPVLLISVLSFIAFIRHHRTRT